MPDPMPQPDRTQTRQWFALLVITAATAMVLGLTLRMPTLVEANDISRWSTVWSILERGTYAIDDCPWQEKTQDKVWRPDKLDRPDVHASALRKLEYDLAPRAWKRGEPTEHYYSSKPPLLPTLIAGVLYPFRRAIGVPLDHVVLQQRAERWVTKDSPKWTGPPYRVRETPRPTEWPAYVYYLKPIVILLNIIPFFIFLILYARLLDRYAVGDWSWLASLIGSAFGTYLFAFNVTLNNHTIAAYSAFFALYPLQRIWDGGARGGHYFALAGFFGAFCACNELPAALFGILLFLMLMIRFPRPTLLYFVPAAAIPCIAFLVTQYIAFAQFTPVYEEFGTKSYQYEGSYWNEPLEFDYLNLHPEPGEVYLFHMTFGHHGIFSLTPIFLFALIAAIVRMFTRRKPLRALAWLTVVLTAAMLAVYTWNPKARNYGGSTQGLRWLFWMIPFWLFFLPMGLAPGEKNRWYRGLTLLALAVSILSVGYAQRSPWTHPWMLDLLEHLNLYHLRR